MIGFLKGKVHFFTDEYVLIDVNNVGYRVNFFHPELLKINEEIIIYTYENVSENDISLFGFRSIEEYDLFVKLISVKGLGAKTASSILAITSPESVISAIENDDLSFFKAISGIGTKTASQIILDLKGKLVKENIDDDKFKDVVIALQQLGYKTTEIRKALKELAKEDLSENEYIKKALNLLKK